MFSIDADPLLSLNGLTTVVRTGQVAVPGFVVSSGYTISAENAETYPAKRTKRSTSETSVPNSPKGNWTVSVGCPRAWWSVTLRDTALQHILQKNGVSFGQDGELEREDVAGFAARVVKAWADAMIGWSASPANRPVTDWDAISLYLGIQPDAQIAPIKLRLRLLESSEALFISTSLLLSNTDTHYDATGGQAEEDRSAGQQVNQLQKKLDAAQQALREERHKYRTMLTSPSSRSRGKGLMLSTPSRYTTSSQSSNAPQSSPSHRSTRTTDPFQAPSSDDLSVKSQELPGTIRTSQRNTSLVNPARAYRAAPIQNSGFVGDSDSD